MLGGFELHDVRPDYWLELAFTILVVAFLALLALRLRDATRSAVLAVACVVTVRIVLIANPISWHLYAQWLDPGTVGWRQHDLIRVERDGFMRPPEGLRYLAVGSSQTGAVYGGYAESHPDFATFVVAAMMPLDFVLYSSAIADRKPHTVLLYLSEFDIAKKPLTGATAVSPLQGFDLPAISRRLASLQGGDDFRHAMAEMAFGEILPELRYRFVFRGMVEQRFKRLAARYGRREPRQPRSTVEERVQWLRQDLAEEYIDFNLAWLQDFLEEMARRGIRVVMVEGHYHPAVGDPRITGLRTRVRNELERLAQRLDSVAFIPRAELYRFTAEDYGDLTHVKPEAGEKFVRQLIKRLDDRPWQ